MKTEISFKRPLQKPDRPNFQEAVVYTQQKRAAARADEVRKTVGHQLETYQSRDQSPEDQNPALGDIEIGKQGTISRLFPFSKTPFSLELTRDSDQKPEEFRLVVHDREYALKNDGAETRTKYGERFIEGQRAEVIDNADGTSVLRTNYDMSHPGEELEALHRSDYKLADELPWKTDSPEADKKLERERALQHVSWVSEQVGDLKALDGTEHDLSTQTGHAVVTSQYPGKNGEVLFDPSSGVVERAQGIHLTTRPSGYHSQREQLVYQNEFAIDKTQPGVEEYYSANRLVVLNTEDNLLSVYNRRRGMLDG